MRVTQKTFWIVESLDSEGFFLDYAYVGGRIEFSRDLDSCTYYSSLGMAKLVIDRIKLDGYTFNLKPRELKISYQIV
jgi:hypothetical protein